MRLFKRKADKQREAIMAQIQEACKGGYCVILGETPTGTRVIVLGRDKLAQQLEEIANKEEVIL